MRDNGVIEARACILTTGTYMDSTVMISSDTRSEGPDGDKTTKDLSKSLRDMGLRLFRLKTGTPQRVLTSSIDFSKTKYEPGAGEFLRFSEETKKGRCSAAGKTGAVLFDLYDTKDTADHQRELT